MKMIFYREHMKYIDFDLKNPRCIHCYINDRAYASVITEVMTNGQNETGGVFLGYIINRAWYIIESVDPGVDTVNQVAFFRWDADYVNHQAERLSKIYQKPLTILGFWHRHPGSMDYFSDQDESTIRSNLRGLREGLLSMLVNIDPKLRMTFYYCYDNNIMPIRYDVGNKYFPVELLKYADSEELSRRASLSGHPLEVFYRQVVDLDAVAARKKAQDQRKGKAPEAAHIAEKAPENENMMERAPEAAHTAERAPEKENTAEKEDSDAAKAAPAGGDSSSERTITEDMIRKIVEIVVGMEGNTKEQINDLAIKVDHIETSISDMSSKMETVLKEVSGKPGEEPAGETDQGFMGETGQVSAGETDQEPAGAGIQINSEENDNG